jgi:hypothetical protein
MITGCDCRGEEKIPAWNSTLPSEPKIATSETKLVANNLKIKGRRISPKSYKNKNFIRSCIPRSASDYECQKLRIAAEHGPVSSLGSAACLLTHLCNVKKKS